MNPAIRKREFGSAQSGVRRAAFGRNAMRPTTWFDVWYPDLAPSVELMAQGQAAVTETEWKRFVRAFKAEMDVPTARRTLDLLAALSHSADLSIGCYCENEARCHRSVLRGLLADRGASLR